MAFLADPPYLKRPRQSYVPQHMVAVIMNNQTNPSWILNLQTSQLGTGLFMLPDVANDNFAAMIVQAVKNLVYSDCLRRGAFAVAFKWVPHNIASYDDLMKAACHPHLCVATCVEPGCMCNTYLGTCQSITRSTSRVP